MIKFQTYKSALEAVNRSKETINYYQKIIDDYLMEHKDHEEINVDELPIYVSMGKTEESRGSELRLGSNMTYFRDAGIWEIGVYKKQGKFYSIDNYGDMPWLDNVELVPITKEEWEKGNEGYIGRSSSYQEDTDNLCCNDKDLPF